MEARLREGMRTAVALAKAELNGDHAAMLALWNAAMEDDAAGLAQSLAALPTLVAGELAVAAGVKVDLDTYYGEVLRQFALLEADDE